MELLSIPAIVALVEALKKARLFPDRFAGLIAIVAGVGFGLLFVELSVTGSGVGLVLGLSASGLYSNAKSVLNS